MNSPDGIKTIQQSLRVLWTHLPLHKGGFGGAPFFGGPMMMRRSRCHGPVCLACGAAQTLYIYRVPTRIVSVTGAVPRQRGFGTRLPYVRNRTPKPTRTLARGPGACAKPPAAFGYFRPDESNRKTRAC